MSQLAPIDRNQDANLMALYNTYNLQEAVKFSCRVFSNTEGDESTRNKTTMAFQLSVTLNKEVKLGLDTITTDMTLARTVDNVFRKVLTGLIIERDLGNLYGTPIWNQGGCNDSSKWAYITYVRLYLVDSNDSVARCIEQVDEPFCDTVRAAINFFPPYGELEVTACQRNPNFDLVSPHGLPTLHSIREKMAKFYFHNGVIKTALGYLQANFSNPDKRFRLLMDGGFQNSWEDLLKQLAALEKVRRDELPTVENHWLGIERPENMATADSLRNLHYCVLKEAQAAWETAVGAPKTVIVTVVMSLFEEVMLIPLTPEQCSVINEGTLSIEIINQKLPTPKQLEPLERALDQFTQILEKQLTPSQIKEIQHTLEVLNRIRSKVEYLKKRVTPTGQLLKPEDGQAIENAFKELQEGELQEIASVQTDFREVMRRSPTPEQLEEITILARQLQNTEEAIELLRKTQDKSDISIGLEDIRKADEEFQRIKRAVNHLRKTQGEPEILVELRSIENSVRLILEIIDAVNDLRKLQNKPKIPMGFRSVRDAVHQMENVRGTFEQIVNIGDTFNHLRKLQDLPKKPILPASIRDAVNLIQEIRTTVNLSRKEQGLEEVPMKLPLIRDAIEEQIKNIEKDPKPLEASEQIVDRVTEAQRILAENTRLIEDIREQLKPVVRSLLDPKQLEKSEQAMQKTAEELFMLIIKKQRAPQQPNAIKSAAKDLSYQIITRPPSQDLAMLGGAISLFKKATCDYPDPRAMEEIGDAIEKRVAGVESALHRFKELFNGHQKHAEMIEEAVNLAVFAELLESIKQQQKKLEANARDARKIH